MMRTTLAAALLCASAATAAEYPPPPAPWFVDERPSLYLWSEDEPVCVWELRGDLLTGKAGTLPDCIGMARIECEGRPATRTPRSEPCGREEELYVAAPVLTAAFASASSTTGALARASAGSVSFGGFSVGGSSSSGDTISTVVGGDTHNHYPGCGCCCDRGSEGGESPSVVPLPAGLPLLAVALGAFGALRWRAR